MLEKWLKRNPAEIKTEEEMRKKATESYHTVLLALVGLVIMAFILLPLVPALANLIILSSIILAIIIISDVIHIRYWDTRVHLLRIEKKLDKLKKE